MARRIALFSTTLVLLLAFVYALLIGVLALAQGRFMYPAPGGGRIAADRGWSEIRLPTSQGRMTAYHLAARPGMPTVMFLHGNATGYRGSVEATRPLAERGIGILIPEYPGYGGNPGTPGEAALAETADAAYDWLARKVQPARIVVYGNSVGTGPAVHVARRPHLMLVLVSPVASMVEVVKHHYPFAPGILVRDKYENARGMENVRGPVLVLHARDDEVVPFGNGRRMAKSGGGRLIALPAGGHGIVFDAWVGRRVADEIEAQASR